MENGVFDLAGGRCEALGRVGKAEAAARKQMKKDVEGREMPLENLCCLICSWRCG